MRSSYYNIFFLLLSFLLFECTTENKNPDTPKIKYGGTLKISINDPVTTLDPAKILYTSDLKTASIIYEGLVEFDSAGNIIPSLAERWEKLDNGRRWVFHLRNNVYFQNDPCFENGKGRKFSASDVLFTFYRIAKPLSGTVAAELFRDKILGMNEFISEETDDIAGIKALDSNKIEFRLYKPFVTFLKLLATPYAYIVPREAVEFYNVDFEKHPVGTGPFRLAQWQRWKEIVLVKNMNYWAKTPGGLPLPFLDKIKLKLIERKKLSVPEFLKGETNIFLLDKPQFKNFSKRESFSGNYGFTVVNKGLGLRFFGFSMDNNGTVAKNKTLRKILFILLENIKQKHPEKFNGEIAYSLIPIHFFKSEYKRLKHSNLNEVKRLIAEIPATEKEKKIELFATIGTPVAEKFVELLKLYQFNIKEKTIKLNYYGEIITRRPDIFRVSMIPSFPDPEEFYMLFYSKSNRNINLCGYENVTYDEIFEKTMFEEDTNKREKLFNRLENILSEDLPALYLTHEGTKYYVYPKSVHGFTLKYNIPSYKSVWINPIETQ